MSAKRRAATELTKDNWDEEEEEVQEAGSFQVASTEDLSKRKIIKAKRRTTGDNEGGGVFKGFKGFSSFSASTLPKSNIVLSSASTSTSPFSSASTTLSESLTKPPVPNSHSETTAPPNSTETRSTNGSSDGSPSFLEQIKSLNQSFINWIQSHVTSNPYVDLTPVFRDYEKHMKDIDSKCCSAGSSTVAQSDTTSNQLNSSQSGVSSSSLLERVPSTSAAAVNIMSSSSFEPVAQSDLQVTSSAATSSHESGNDVATSSSTGDLEEQNKDEHEDDAPCKPDRLATPEDGAFYSVRCKLYFKRPSGWSDLGVGMINLKNINEKTQILMRNDTSVGKILLNVFLSSSTPVSRSGKNNVIFVSVPNPPLYSKPTDGDNSLPATYLIRVKTADDADKLHRELISKKEASS